MEKETQTSQPFLKWAGGKRWLIEKYPHLFKTEYKRLIEPFVGSGAVFFFLSPARAILNDSNTDLINTYISIKEDWKSVLKNLQKHQRNHSKEYYYTIRDREYVSRSAMAAKFIYLNRTCWNGLYRVNAKGSFNVPIGTRSSVILGNDDFEKVSNTLRKAKLFSNDFSKVIKDAKYGDFIFADPPYTVKHNNNGFIKYNESLFSWEDQLRLKEDLQSAVKRGAKALITNAFHPSIKELYKGFGEQIKIIRPSRIAANASARGYYEEVAIKCY
ncbi:DNA adenine methylase [Leptospira selangorensis]|uniref:DNA adenine methylase n=1 Tax=Leptospira selangorensis TaxID=2484982 RepID=UPI001FC931A8|nr:Dam family site-specific DNA-(adenine-N6)-methyltransferase [Leptospira selangorensis]